MQIFDMFSGMSKLERTAEKLVATQQVIQALSNERDRAIEANDVDKAYELQMEINQQYQLTGDVK